MLLLSLPPNRNTHDDRLVGAAACAFAARMPQRAEVAGQGGGGQAAGLEARNLRRVMFMSALQPGSSTTKPAGRRPSAHGPTCSVAGTAVTAVTISALAAAGVWPPVSTRSTWSTIAAGSPPSDSNCIVLSRVPVGAGDRVVRRERVVRSGCRRGSTRSIAVCVVWIRNSGARIVRALDRLVGREVVEHRRRVVGPLAEVRRGAFQRLPSVTPLSERIRLVITSTGSFSDPYVGSLALPPPARFRIQSGSP